MISSFGGHRFDFCARRSPDFVKNWRSNLFGYQIMYNHAIIDGIEEGTHKLDI